MNSNLEAKTVDSESVLITEHNVQKKRYKEIYGNTFSSVRTAIESGKIDQIPPIIALQNPFLSLDHAIQAYQEYANVVPRQGGQHYEHEEEVLKEILEQNVFLCYNGNRRLEEFQKAGIPIRAFVITSQGEYELMPEEEKRIPKRLRDERPVQYEIDQNYVLSYLSLLDDVVYIHAEKRHWDNLDTKELLSEMGEKRRKKR